MYFIVCTHSTVRVLIPLFCTDDIVVCGLVLLVLLVVIIGIVIGASAGPPAERPLRLGRYMTTITSCGPVEG